MFPSCTGLIITGPTTKSESSTNPPSLAHMFMPNQIAEMQKVNNSANPLVLPIRKVLVGWAGHILDQDNGKWLEWSYSMDLELSMAQLWEYMFNASTAPHPMYEPHMHCAWGSNNCLACSFIKQALSSLEQKLCANQHDLVALWAYLKDRHGGAVLVQQVCLLQEALTMKCSPSESLTKTVDNIIEKIN